MSTSKCGDMVREQLQEFSTRTGHEHRKRSAGEDWGRRQSAHMRGASSIFQKEQILGEGLGAC